MLQIISKKFFENDDENTYYKTEEKAIIYSNIDIRDLVETPIAQLERIESDDGITTYLMKYTNCIEKKNLGGLSFVSVGQSEIISDFCCCCTFWFNAIFSPDKDYVQRLIRTKRESKSGNDAPVSILPSFFSQGRILNEYDVEFSSFIHNLILLKRDYYIKIIKVIRQYYDALLLINTNLNLSYTLFVATIESLAQNFDGYTTDWDDCPDNITKRMNCLFNYLDDEIVSEIKSIIIEEFHTKMSRRYEEFSNKHIDSDYYLNSIDQNNIIPIKKSSLKWAIKSSYSIRSQYVHSLKSLPNEFKLATKSETFGEGRKRTFSFVGITRFCRHIILSVINDLEKLEKESYNYFYYIPGTYTISTAPQYWIHKAERLTVHNITSYFNKFINYFLSIRIGAESSIVDMREICKKIENIFYNVNKENRTRLLIIYILYNSFVGESYRIETFNKFISNKLDYLGNATLEEFIFYELYHCTGNVENQWTIDELLSIYNEYNEKRHWKGIIKIPRVLETCLLIEIANLYLEDRDNNSYDKYIYKAIEENPGNCNLIDIIEHISKDKREKIDWELTFLK